MWKSEHRCFGYQWNECFIFNIWFYDDKVEVQEHFLGSIEIKGGTGEGLRKHVMDIISDFNFDISNLRGQGYDQICYIYYMAHGLPP